MAIPDSEALSTSTIASYIGRSFTKETDKIRAAYTWVVHNIEYDTDSMYAVNWNMGGSLKITESLRRRKGVCENFAGIFVDILTRAGFTAIPIDGYTKEGNLISKTGHTWCAVYTDDDWFLFDPTWDKGRQHDYRYFRAAPSAFADSHMPFDPLWQFTDNPITHNQFQNRGAGKTEAIPNHVDSIKAFMRLSELDKLQATARRMEKTDKVTELIKNRTAFLRMQIATIYEERDMLLYNGAVADLNKATDAYNKYIGNLNSHTSVPNHPHEFNRVLEPAMALIREAFTKVAEIGKFIPSLQYDPSHLKIRLQEISDKILAQKRRL